MRPKAHKRPFTRGKYRNEFIHIDIQVYPIAGYDGAKYSGAILDDYTQYGTVQALKRKDELTRMVSQYLATHTTPERPCRRMRLDQAGETRDKLFINNLPQLTNTNKMGAFKSSIELSLTSYRLQ
jgi:hypothetical protein